MPSLKFCVKMNN